MTRGRGSLTVLNWRLRCEDQEVRQLLGWRSASVQWGMKESTVSSVRWDTIMTARAGASPATVTVTQTTATLTPESATVSTTLWETRVTRALMDTMEMLVLPRLMTASHVPVHG